MEDSGASHGERAWREGEGGGIADLCEWSHGGQRQTIKQIYVDCETVTFGWWQTREQIFVDGGRSLWSCQQIDQFFGSSGRRESRFVWIVGWRRWRAMEQVYLDSGADPWGGG